jgi:hypothetical protein
VKSASRTLPAATAASYRCCHRCPASCPMTR